MPVSFSIILGTFYYTSITHKPINEIGLGDFLIPLMIALTLGTFMYLSKLRDRVCRYSKEIFSAKVKNQIFKLYTAGLSRKQRKYLYKSMTLQSRLNQIIDNNDTIKRKIINGFFTGLFWTTMADLLFVSASFAILYFISGILFQELMDEMLSGALVMLAMALLLFVTQIFALKRRARLSKEQIIFIQGF